MIGSTIIVILGVIGCFVGGYYVASWLDKRERKQYKIKFDRWYKDYMRKFD